MNIRRDVGRARNEWQFIRIDRSLVRYENKSISSQITAFGRPLCRSSTGECHLTGYLVCTNTLCSIIRSLYAAVSVLKWSPPFLLSFSIIPSSHSSNSKNFMSSSTLSLAGNLRASTAPLRMLKTLITSRLL